MYCFLKNVFRNRMRIRTMVACAALGFCGSGAVWAQENCRPDPANLRKADFHYQKALTAYREGLNNQAWKLLGIAQKVEPCFAEIYMLKAVLFEDEKKIDSAIAAYRHALTIDPEVFPNAYFSLAKLEAACGRYAEAESHFTRYLSYKNISAKLREQAQMAQLRNREAMRIADTAVPFQPKNLGENINTEYDEYLPLVTVDDQTMFFTRRYFKEAETPYLEEDFFFSVRDTNGNWMPAERMAEPINSNENEGALCISPDGRYLFFAGCNRHDGMGSCDIYASIRRGDVWGRPFNIGSPVNTSAWESQPCMSSDGRTLYFVSNRAGGFGKSDIWKSELSDGGIWSEPVNLGNTINTSGDESSPFLHPDGKTLYFSSNGHGGMGGLDLFVSRLDENGNWSVPQNLGYPINTYADEATLSVNSKGDTAYFSSDNLSGFGKKDIYSFALYEQARPASVSFMKGVVYDADTRKPLAARFELISLKTGKTRISSMASSKKGDFLVCLPVDEPFALNVSFPGYLFYSEHIALDYAYRDRPMRKEILLQPIRSGTSIVLNNIFYRTGEYAIEESSTAELNRLVRFLMQNKEVHIEISGHTDNVGSAAFNRELSQNRANAVAAYIVKKGIDANRIKAVGYGFDRPLADNETEEGRARNRRTELKIL